MQSSKTAGSPPTESVREIETSFWTQPACFLAHADEASSASQKRPVVYSLYTKGMSFHARSQVGSEEQSKKLVIFQALFLSATFYRRTVQRLSIMTVSVPEHRTALMVAVKHGHESVVTCFWGRAQERDRSQSVI
jgi:hypothetical protein